MHYGRNNPELIAPPIKEPNCPAKNATVPNSIGSEPLIKKLIISIIVRKPEIMLWVNHLLMRSILGILLIEEGLSLNLIWPRNTPQKATKAIEAINIV